MYRPGTKHPTLSLSDQMSQFLDLLSNLCNNLTSQNQIFYILGDLNIDVLKYNSCNFTRDYVELLFSYGLLQVITKPTRCSLNSATLIDHVITNSQASSHDSHDFPIYTVKLNKKSVCIEKWMTRGLLISRTEKMFTFLFNFFFNCLVQGKRLFRIFVTG